MPGVAPAIFGVNVATVSPDAVWPEVTVGDTTVRFVTELVTVAVEEPMTDTGGGGRREVDLRQESRRAGRERLVLASNDEERSGRRHRHAGERPRGRQRVHRRPDASRRVERIHRRERARRWRVPAHDVDQAVRARAAES